MAKPASFSHTTSSSSPIIQLAFITSSQPRISFPPTVLAPSRRRIIDLTSNDADASEKGVGRSLQKIERGANSLKIRGDNNKKELRTALRQISDLKSKDVEGSRELRNAKMRIEQLEAAKEKGGLVWESTRATQSSPFKLLTNCWKI